MLVKPESEEASDESTDISGSGTCNLSLHWVTDYQISEINTIPFIFVIKEICVEFLDLKERNFPSCVSHH